MNRISSRAPGKIILFGEHAVVYQYPAIAVPVTQVYTEVTIEENIEEGIFLYAPAISIATQYDLLPAENHLVAAINEVKSFSGMSQLPAMKISITSTIPVASGLGSGAAVSVALMRSLFSYLGKEVSDQEISNMAFQVEKIHHGTPSGIDNTVIAFERSVFFIKGQPIEFADIIEPFTIIIADSGIKSPTINTVMDVRKRWQENPVPYNAIFSDIGAIVQDARESLRTGNLENLGILMNTNHSLLQRLDVSCEALDCLVGAALDSGAMGAKLSGGGRGGNMIAIAQPENADRVSASLYRAGAKNTVITTIYPA